MSEQTYDEYNNNQFKKLYANFQKTKVLPDYYDLMFVRSEHQLAVHTANAKGLQIPYKTIKNFLNMYIFDEISEYGVYKIPYTMGTLKAYYATNNIQSPEGFSMEDIKKPWVWVIFAKHAGMNPIFLGF